MSASQRTKGAAGEREVCALLTEEFGRKATRELSQTRDGGHDISYPPFHIEVKRRKRLDTLYKWLGQAENKWCDVLPDDPPEAVARLAYPTLMLRADGKEWLVVMRFPDWATLARGEIR